MTSNTENFHYDVWAGSALPKGSPLSIKCPVEAPSTCILSLILKLLIATLSEVITNVFLFSTNIQFFKYVAQGVRSLAEPLDDFHRTAVGFGLLPCR
jgi:hypothetical protein